MKHFLLFVGIIVSVSGITMAFKAHQAAKKYSVTLPLQQWIQVSNELEYIKGQLRQSDLPSKQVAFMSDSLLTPLLTTIGQQVNAQIQQETKKDTIKPKKP
jgi:hypothetical protein